MIYDVVSQASPAKASFIEQHFVLLAGAGVGRTPQPNENCACEVLSISVIVFFWGDSLISEVFLSYTVSHLRGQRLGCLNLEFLVCALGKRHLASLLNI